MNPRELPARSTAAAVLALAAIGDRRMAKGHPALRLAPTTQGIVIGILVTLAIVHLVRGGMDPAGDFC